MDLHAIPNQLNQNKKLNTTNKQNLSKNPSTFFKVYIASQETTQMV